jgi:hypothetical protein
MEVTKWLKPSECVSRIGDSASVQAVTRVKPDAARIAAPFVHPKPASRKPDLIIKDPYGFEIDPAAARELRDAYRSYWPLVINMSKYLPDKPYWDASVRFKKMEVNLGGTPTFLDVEGLPDRDFYYLVGLRFESERRRRGTLRGAPARGQGHTHDPEDREEIGLEMVDLTNRTSGSIHRGGWSMQRHSR